MRKTSYLLLAALVLSLGSVTLYKKLTAGNVSGLSDVLPEGEGEEGYDGAAARNAFEFEQLKDPALGYVPMERMIRAVDVTEALKTRFNYRTASPQSALQWAERGPVYDLVGPSNGNTRAGTHYTAGRIRAVLIDTLNDPSGNTVFIGGIAGGLWKCTNFLSGVPNWVPLDDRFDNLAVSSLCQDPTDKAVMYFATGEGTSNSDAVYGGGVWKSTNGGTTWTRLPSAKKFIRTFKISCDSKGNVYLGNRFSPAPASAGAATSGLYRSTDGGTSWVDITPSPVTSTNSICTDIEISSTGRLHASFGYGGPKVQHVYTDVPSTVDPASWKNSDGLRLSDTRANRLELAVQGDVLYGVTTNSTNNLDSCYKSVDGGATWTKQNTTAFSTGILSSQGWYNLTLAINPENTSEFMVGGLDAYKSSDNGVNISKRMTHWVATAPYVHADHHFMQWWKVGDQSRVVIGNDGGMFLSNDGGATWVDRNRNLAIKQFYSAAIHPDAGTNYMLAGSQDNGVHQLTEPGLGWSTEVTGGDGAFVHINQQNPQVQFGSYVFNNYRISTNGGATWSPRLITTGGLFINPFDYDDGQNIMYASNGASGGNNQIVRWADAHASGAATILTVSSLARTNAGNATALKVSPYTKNRVYIGTNNGKVVQLSNANSVSPATVNDHVKDLSGTALPSGYISCVNTGSSDSFLVATFTSYGVSHVWYSANGGTDWTAIDGNLPDMPVRWALFDPQSNNRILLATEAGVYSTTAVNGAATVWTADPNFPTVRTDMLKLRLSDNTIVAATHGRGLFTATLPSVPEVRFSAPFATLTESSAGGNVACRGYRDYTINISITGAPAGDATVSYSLESGFSAIEGVDFDITTNGDFTAPSKQHLFAGGSKAAKVITLRIYDDAEVEPLKELKIKMTVSGSTNAIAGSAATYQVSLQDNDRAPEAPGIGVGQIGSGNYGAYIQPFRGNYQKARSQYIYLASELLDAGFGPGNITSLGFNITSKSSTSAYNGLTISLKNTTTASFSTIQFENGTTPYFSGDHSTALGVNTFAFSTPFVWDGVSNILVEICYDNASLPGGTGDNVSSNSTPDIRGIWNRDAAGTGCSLAAVYSGVGSAYVRPDIRLNGNRLNNAVETTLNGGKSNYLSGGSGTTHFYSAGKKIVASITNATNHDYGCTQVTVDRSGTGAAPFTTNTAANFLMEKTFQVSPAINSATGRYRITLYYTAEEKTGWEAATGQQWSNIKLIKVKSRISNYSPASPAPDGPDGVEAVTPEFGTYGNGFTLSATFSTGFSGFGAGLFGSCTAPTITAQPVAQTVCPGAAANFSVTGSSAAALSYQWRKGGVAISGATAATFSIPSVTASHAGNYDVVITNSCGSVSSTSVALTVNTPVSITTQPVAKTVCVGAAGSFTVAAEGTALTYQWRKGGSAIAGATSATYSIAATTTADAGTYDVVVTNSCGSVTSASASLTVNNCTTSVPTLNADVTGILLVPNPVGQRATLQVTSRRPMAVEWSVVDAKGRTVLKFRQSLEAGVNRQALQVAQLPGGTYYLFGQTSRGKLGTIRFVKI